jgi:uncharacterized protein HemY
MESLLSLCGMSSSEANLAITNVQAEVHKCKSEYNEAWKIHTEIVQTYADRDPYWHAGALLNLAEIGVLMGVPKRDVQQNIELARLIFTTIGRKSMIICWDSTLGDLYLREQDLLGAKTHFEKSLKLASEDSEVESFCFE